ncbi:unnamed protein product [Schistosoma curassoni]|uniref:Uncharacterized protein n=1 Tax=Schistosoma curassoni TaxID=6186 RepID=A0A183KPT5_9TREM|nr:unnamed protein product [Schistosoma curassoni]
MRARSVVVSVNNRPSSSLLFSAVSLSGNWEINVLV